MLKAGIGTPEPALPGEVREPPSHPWCCDPGPLPSRSCERVPSERGAVTRGARLDRSSLLSRGQGLQLLWPARLSEEVA